MLGEDSRARLPAPRWPWLRVWSVDGGRDFWCGARVIRLIQLALGFSLAVAVGRLNGQTVFGTTRTDLVTVDVTTGTTANVGALSLPADSYFITLTWQPVEGKLYGLVYTVVSNVVTNHFLAKIDPATGSTTTMATFGALSSNLLFEGLTYVPNLGVLVASRSQVSNNSLTQDLVTLSTSGVATLLVTTSPAIDNDTIVYDSHRSALYGIDPNGVNVLRSINLVTGAYTDVGPGIATIGALAYSPFTDRLYGISYASNDHALYVMDPSNAALLATLTTSGSQLTALAVAIPEPAEWALLVAIAGGAIATCRSKRRVV